MQEAPLMEDYINEDGEFDFDGFVADNDLYQAKIRARRLKKKIIQDYLITEEQWENTPLEIKKILIDLNHEVERFEQLMYELESWRDSMPI